MDSPEQFLLGCNFFTFSLISKLLLFSFTARPVKQMDMVVILVPSVAIPFVLGCILVGLCFCRKRKGKPAKNENGDANFTMGKPIDLNNLTIRKVSSSLKKCSNIWASIGTERLVSEINRQSCIILQNGFSKLAQLLRRFYRCGRSGVRFPGQSNHIQCRQRFATAATFLRSRVAQALSRVDEPRHSLHASTKYREYNEDLILFL